MRTAVNIDDHRMLGRDRHSQRPGKKRFDLIFIVVADKSEGLHFRNLFSCEKLRVQIRQLTWRAAPALHIKFRQVSRRRVTVKNGTVFRDRESTDKTRLLHDILRFSSRNRQPHQIVAPSLLHREVHRVSVRTPMRRALPVVNGRADFAPVASIGVHQPHMCIFHRGFAVGQSAACSAKKDFLAIG